ncbi:MAG: hypothetical protein EA409_12255 [Saprospirales bacterium]|nr:MAG: hypothetical protein EA409_12255 [Saprospirales bacterium]
MKIKILSLVFGVLFPLAGLFGNDKPIVHLEFVHEQKGEEVHYHILAGNFLNVVSLQGTFQWSLDSMEFVRIGKFGLPGMNSSNFNTKVAKDGVLLISWFTMDVRNGVTMDACDTLMTFIFKAPHGPGQLNMVSDPLMIEFHNSSLKELQLMYDIRSSCSYACTGHLFRKNGTLDNVFQEYDLASRHDNRAIYEFKHQDFKNIK